MRRTQWLAAILVLAMVVGGAAYADLELGPRSLSPGGPGVAPSGAWYCPHGGGPEGWQTNLQVANPGGRPATIRVRSLGPRRPAAPETYTVEPGAFIQVPVAADGRARASTVAWFGQWVAVGWVAHAGGDERGVAAEPCSPGAGRRWLLPEGTTETEDNDDFVIVMNPSARAAVVSVTLFSERRIPVRRGDLTNVALGPFRTMAVRLNDVVKGELTVSALVEASSGRVVAGTLGLSRAGGLRSSLGYLGRAPAEAVFPGGADAGRTDLTVMSTGADRLGLAGELLGREGEQPFGGLADASPRPESGKTYPTTTDGPMSVAFVASGEGVAAGRRSYGAVSDQGSTPGAVPAAAWLVLPSVVGPPWHPGLFLANPAPEPAEVTLWHLSPGGSERVIVTVPPRRTVSVRAFAGAAPDVAVVAVASAGTFVPAGASYSLGREGFATYAVALGVPIPVAWVPS